MTTKTITIGEMIPRAAWPAIEQLIAEGKMTARDFNPVLVVHRAEMEAKGVLPEYAAYALEYAINRSKREGR